MPLGAVVLRALLQCRRPEARLLLLYVCVPQVLLSADQLSRPLVALECIEMLAVRVRFVRVSVYLAALRRPSIGPVPARLNGALVGSRVPTWLRGTAGMGASRSGSPDAVVP
jgi:hypothetical protein